MTEEERKTITQAVQTAKKRIAEAAIASRTQAGGHYAGRCDKDE